MLRPRFLLISLASTIFTAAICGFVFWVLAKSEDTAREASTQFAGALVDNDPSLAPKGGADYLEGLRGHFGNVSSARLIEARNHQVGSGDDARTYHVADLLLQTARGAAVVELEFDSMQLISDTVTNVRELEPREIKGLDDAQLTAVAKGFVARGGEPATSFTAPAIAKVAQTPPPAAKPKKAAVSPEIRKAKQQLRCVQRAKGDVDKLTRCAS
jgi:hypothetical protein